MVGAQTCIGKDGRLIWAFEVVPRPWVERWSPRTLAGRVHLHQVVRIPGHVSAVKSSKTQMDNAGFQFCAIVFRRFTADELFALAMSAFGEFMFQTLAYELCSTGHSLAAPRTPLESP